MSTKPSTKPLAIDGDIAVFPPKKIPSGQGDNRREREYYVISDGPRDGTKIYTHVPKELAGGTINENDALELYKGGTIWVDGQSQEGNAYQALAAGFKVNTSKKEVDDKENPGQKKIYENRYLDVRTALAVKNEAGDVIGYNIRKGRGDEARDVTVYNTVGKKDDPIKISLSDALQLIEGETVETDTGVKLKLSGTEERESKKTHKKYDVAKIDIEWPKRAQGEGFKSTARPARTV